MIDVSVGSILLLSERGIEDLSHLKLLRQGGCWYVRIVGRLIEEARVMLFSREWVQGRLVGMLG